MYQLRAVRTLPLPVVDLFNYWTVPELLGHWLPPANSHLLAVDIAPRCSYSWLLRYETEQVCYAIHGQLRTLSPPTRLVTSWHWQRNPHTTLLELRLHALNARSTELDLRHTTFADAASRNLHRQFWQQALARLASQA